MELRKNCKSFQTEDMNERGQRSLSSELLARIVMKLAQNIPSTFH